MTDDQPTQELPAQNVRAGALLCARHYSRSQRWTWKELVGTFFQGIIIALVYIGDQIGGKK